MMTRTMMMVARYSRVASEHDVIQPNWRSAHVVPSKVYCTACLHGWAPVKSHNYDVGDDRGGLV